MKKPYVFISYKREEVETAQRLASLLSDLGKAHLDLVYAHTWEA